jgi:hypothetical protein
VGLFGGYPIARNIHLAIMFLIVAFMIVHVVLAAIFPRTLVSMIVGTGRTEMPKMNGRVPVIKYPGYPVGASSASASSVLTGRPRIS